MIAWILHNSGCTVHAALSILLELESARLGAHPPPRLLLLRRPFRSKYTVRSPASLGEENSSRWRETEEHSVRERVACFGPARPSVSPFPAEKCRQTIRRHEIWFARTRPYFLLPGVVASSPRSLPQPVDALFWRTTRRPIPAADINTADTPPMTRSAPRGMAVLPNTARPNIPETRHDAQRLPRGGGRTDGR